jgi:multiple sugar transport system ATP-binding protein
VYVTHDQIEAMTMGDRVAVMRKGLLQQVDDPQVLYDEPINLFVGGFIGSPPMNMAEVTVVEHGQGGLALEFGDQRVALDDESVAARPGLRAYVGRLIAVGIRAEDMSQPGPRNEVPEDRRLRSTALLTEALGSEIVVHFEVPAPAVRTEDAKELEEDTGLGDIAGVGTGESGTKFVASFSPRSRVRPGDAIEVGLDTTRLYCFDLDTGLAIR